MMKINQVSLLERNHLPLYRRSEKGDFAASPLESVVTR